MSYLDVEQRPTKKRRFFVDDPSTPERIIPATSSSAAPSLLAANSPSARASEQSPDGCSHTPSSQTASSIYDVDLHTPRKSPEIFDRELFENFVGGNVAEATIKKLEEIASGDTARAINMYLDGSWQDDAVSEPQNNSDSHSALAHTKLNKDRSTVRPIQELPHQSRNLSLPPSAVLDRRYVGAFGVAAWATRSGPSRLQHGQEVKIERAKNKPTGKIGRGGRIATLRQRSDVVVRFTNSQGEEVGRLPQETASWVAPLIDQKVCHFEGICVFSPDRLRINDTIYIQLRCSLLNSTFEKGGLVKPANNNRTTGVFEEKETAEEQELRLRQVALVKLFEEINLHPSTLNEITARHKRQCLLQAAEIAEQYENSSPKFATAKSVDSGTSNPPTDEEPEDGKELEQDQLDTLYKKAQSFDFNTPSSEPAESFAMDLRKYQKQALHWMISKEKDELTEGKDSSMHPLWEEYVWPAKDVDGNELPCISGQSSFYLNPYSGELSLEFPRQEQNCLGGILADGKLDVPA